MIQIHFFQLTGQFGPIETMSCYCSKDLCNNQNFNNKKFQRWSKEAKKILKSKLTSFNLTIFEVVLNAFPCIVVLLFVSIMLNFCWNRRRNINIEQQSTDTSKHNLNQPDKDAKTVEDSSEEKIKKCL